MKVGAIARAHMALFAKRPPKLAQSKPAKSSKRTVAPAVKRRKAKVGELLGVRMPRSPSYEVGAFALVPHGRSVQVAVIERIELENTEAAGAVTLRAFAARSERWTAPRRIPLNRLLGVPAEDDPRLVAARASIASGGLAR